MSPATFGRWLAVLVTVLAGGGTGSVARAADVAFDGVGDSSTADTGATLAVASGTTMTAPSVIVDGTRSAFGRSSRNPDA